MIPVEPLWARAFVAYEQHFLNHPGKRTLLRTALRALGARMFGWRMRNGMLVAISPRDGLAPFWTVGWTCFQRREWEPHVERALREIVRPGNVAIDVGANLGYFSLVLAQLVGAGGRVYAFEPVPSTFAQLEATRALNDVPQLEPLRLALGSERGTIELRYNPRITGMATAHDATGGALASAQAEVRTLDELVASSRVARPNVIKIDVEGHELDVLRGAARTIAEARPAIVFELNAPMSRRAGWTLADVRALLPEYDFALLEDSGSRPLEGDPKLGPDDYVDVLATAR